MEGESVSTATLQAQEMETTAGYPCGMAKRKVSLRLDEDLVAELRNADETLSAQVNDAIRREVERRRRNRNLRKYLDSLDAQYGPAPVDQELVETFKAFL